MSVLTNDIVIPKKISSQARGFFVLKEKPSFRRIFRKKVKGGDNDGGRFYNADYYG